MDDEAATTLAIAYQPVDLENPPPLECLKRKACLRQYYQNLTLQVGPARALDLLIEHGETAPPVQDQCHDATHAIGEAAGRLAVLQEAMSAGDERCGSGYYHGVVATTLTMTGTEDGFALLVASCGQETGSFMRWECFHGIGHSLLFNFGGEIARSLETCAEIPADKDKGACASGALMEEVVTNATDVERYGEDPYVACRDLDDQVLQGTCFDMNAAIVVTQRVTDEERFAVCETVVERHRGRCHAGLGRSVFGGMPLEGARTEEFCAHADDTSGVELCVAAAVDNSAAHYGTGEEALRHCDEFSVPRLREVCFETLETNWGVVLEPSPSAPRET